MQIPKNARKQKQYEKQCQYPGCSKIFFGITITKYCHEHRKEEYRIRKRSQGTNLSLHRVIEHDHKKVVEKEVKCEHCKDAFNIKIFPRQKVYPLYCEKHRNLYQRERSRK